MRRKLTLSLAAFLASAVALHAADYPAPTEGDYVIHDFGFQSGETLPAVRMHYRTLGKPVRDKDGIVRNAVLMLRVEKTSGKIPEAIRELQPDPCERSQRYLDHFDPKRHTNQNKKGSS